LGIALTGGPVSVDVVDDVLQSASWGIALHGALLTSHDSFKFEQVLHTNETAVDDKASDLYAFIRYTETGGSNAVYTQPLFVGGLDGDETWLPAQLSVRTGVTAASTAAGSGDAGKTKVVTIMSVLECDAYQPPPT
jgi:hypothetical protein